MTDFERLAPVAPRAWNTWAGIWPARMVNLPLGLLVRPCAYSASGNEFTEFRADHGGVVFGERTIHGERIALTLRHHGTELDWQYDVAADGTLRSSWSARAFGEWGLRFWLLLGLEWIPPGSNQRVAWHYDATEQVLLAHHGEHVVAVAGSAAPLMVTFHADAADLKNELESHGYFYLASRGIEGEFPCLRYNLEEMPQFQFAIGIGASQTQAVARARPDSEPLKVQTSDQDTGAAGAFAAMRDIIGWNTVWDAFNQRPYTLLSRYWVEQKFGGFGLWLDDIFYHAWMASLFSPAIAKENLAAVLSNAQPAGNLPCLMTGRDSWIDRSQPPMVSLATWMIWAHTGEDSVIDLAYDRLLANHEWWFRHRDGNGDGLMEWGTSPVGTGLYRGTKLGAKNESSMDNSPIHDEASLDSASGTLTAADIGLNSLLVLDGEILSGFAERRGDVATSERLRRRSKELAERIKAFLWDESRGVFANRLWEGRFIRSVAPTSFYPMLAGIAEKPQVESLMRWLDDPAKFGGKLRLPSVTRDDPAYHDNVYWRGRIWPPLNLLVYLGLCRAGEFDEAKRLAADSSRLFFSAWQKRQCPENFNAETGEADDQPDTDLFYGWGGLLPLIAVYDAIMISPWDGLTVQAQHANGSLGPILIGGRATELRPEGDRTILLQDGVVVFAFSGVGRLRQLAFDNRRFQCLCAGNASFEFAQRSIDDIAGLHYAGQALEPRMENNVLTIRLAESAEALLEIRWRGGPGA